MCAKRFIPLFFLYFIPIAAAIDLPPRGAEAAAEEKAGPVLFVFGSPGDELAAFGLLREEAKRRSVHAVWIYDGSDEKGKGASVRNARAGAASAGVAPSAMRDFGARRGALDVGQYVTRLQALLEKIKPARVYAPAFEAGRVERATAAFAADRAVSGKEIGLFEFPTAGIGGLWSRRADLMGGDDPVTGHRFVTMDKETVRLLKRAAANCSGKDAPLAAAMRPYFDLEKDFPPQAWREMPAYNFLSVKMDGPDALKDEEARRFRAALLEHYGEKDAGPKQEAAARGDETIRSGRDGDEAWMENASGVRLTVNLESGLFHVDWNGVRWLGEGSFALRSGGKWLSNSPSRETPDGGARLLGFSFGEDNPLRRPGRFISMLWIAGPVEFSIEFHLSADDPLIEFRHVFPQGHSARGSADGRPALNFPVFKPAEEDRRLGLFSYSDGLWPHPILGGSLGGFLDGSAEGTALTPAVFFDAGGRTAILSASGDFLVRTARVLDLGAAGGGKVIGSGLSGEVLDVPPGHSSPTVLRFGTGIGRTMMEWGGDLMAAAGKTRALDDGPFLGTLGYWTDSGAYYYYKTEPGQTYENTLLKLRESWKADRIPVRYLQLDSWWYPKSASDRGVMTWTPAPEMFPDGLSEFQKKLDLPLALHNRYFSRDTPYRETFDFRDGEGGTHPVGRRVFDLWAEQADAWGAILYEQDWLHNQFEKIGWLRSDVESGARWLDDLTGAMEDRGLEVQFCMPAAAFHLESTRHPNVTNIRTSNDYSSRLRDDTANARLWWEHVYVSPLAWSLGLYPFKDVFLTAASPKTNANPAARQLSLQGREGDEGAASVEPYARQEALLSILGAGPVGIGDRVGMADRELVLRIADEAGVLVKPDRPLTPVDGMYRVDPRGQAVALIGSSESRHDGLTWHYVLALNVFEGLGAVKLEWGADDLGLTGNYVLYDARDGTALPYDPQQTVKDTLPPAGYGYWTLAPLSGQGRALIGDVGKDVSASNRRIAGWSDRPGRMDVRLNGPAGTKTRLLIYAPDKPAGAAFEGTKEKLTKRTGADGAKGAAPGWEKAGENLYLFEFDGGAGRHLRIDF